MAAHGFPKLHNAMWPGLVGKGSPGAEPSIDLDTMLEMTANASVDGVKFDGVDLFLVDPHVSIDSTADELKRLADKIARKGFVVGSLESHHAICAEIAEFVEAELVSVDYRLAPALPRGLPKAQAVARRIA